MSRKNMNKEIVVAEEIVKVATTSEISKLNTSTDASAQKKADIEATLAKLPKNVWKSVDSETLLKVGDDVVVEKVEPCKNGKKFAFRVTLRSRHFGKNNGSYSLSRKLLTNCGEYKVGMTLRVQAVGKQWAEPYISANEPIQKLKTPFTSSDGKVTFEYVQHVRLSYTCMDMRFIEI